MIYKCVKRKNAYKTPYARIKPFLSSFGRKRMFEFVMSNNLLDKVISIHTDRIALTEDIDFSHLKYYPTPEKKSSGKIIFHNSVNYFHICEICNSEYRYVQGCQHCKS